MSCEYCDETFSSRRAEISHVLAEHGDDLTSHERDALKRERNDLSADTETGLFDRLPVSRSLGLTVLAVAVLVAGGYGLASTGIVSFQGGGGASGPTGSAGTGATPASVGPVGSTHEHATFSVVVDGAPIDFGQPRYQVQSSHVHFENGDGSTIHSHATGVTIGYALDTLGLGINGTCLTVHADTYCESTGNVTTTVDGQELDNGADHVIRDGETIRIRYASN